jgi:TonB family protein
MKSKSTYVRVGLDHFIHSLIRYAARTAPASLSERLEEEWLADLAARSTVLSRLRFAVGCCWATRVIAYEHSGTPVVLASSASGQGSVARLGLPDFSPLSPRGTISLLIIAAHAVVIYGFASIFVHGTVNLPGPMKGFIYDPPTPAHDVPAKLHMINLIGTGKQFKLGKVDPVDIRFPADDTDNDSGNSLTTKEGEGSTQIPAHPTRLIGGAGPGFPRTDDYYPSAARRLGEMGLTIIRVCVNNKGRLSADPAIAQSSGSIRLDEGALKLAKAGSGHYRATTQDGAPVNDCYPFRIRFQLAE